MIERFLPIFDQSYFLFGPRVTGKSTWLKSFYKDALFLEVDFILSGPDCFYAIEVKNGKSINPKD